MNSLTLAYLQMKLTHLPYFRSNWDSSLKPNDCIRFPFSLESCQDFHVVRSETQPWIGTETGVKSKFYQHLTSTFLGFNTFANAKWMYQLISLFKDHTAHIKPQKSTCNLILNFIILFKAIIWWRKASNRLKKKYICNWNSSLHSNKYTQGSTFAYA